MQAWREAAAELLGRWGAYDHPVPNSTEPQLHLQVQGRWAGRHAVVACSHFLPPGFRARRLNHPAQARSYCLPISETSQGDPHSYRFHIKPESFSNLALLVAEMLHTELLLF
jgi:hypothetical protein